MKENLGTTMGEKSLTGRLWSSLRAGEKVALGFFTYRVLEALVAPLALRERATLISLNAAVGAVFLGLSWTERRGQNRLLGALRDWLPCALIVLAYRESGLFLLPDVSHRLDLLFIGWDRALLENPWVRSVAAAGSPWLERYFELAYLLTYPFVLLGFAAVYWARDRRRTGGGRSSAKAIEAFWAMVLLAVLTCYALFPFFPLTPPRVLFHDGPGPDSHPLLRGMNLWILDRYSVQACIFPSGHVAGAVATALAVRAHRPRLGALFLFAAASIAAATVFDRYHYAADAVAGALIGAAAYALSGKILRARPAPAEAAPKN